MLIINPGSTTTKVALYDGPVCRVTSQIDHDPEELRQFPSVGAQFDYRKEAINKWLQQYETVSIAAIVARGGLLRPLKGGCYEVDESMKRDLWAAEQGEHASNLGGLIADALAKPLGVCAYIVDPVSIDEYDDVARLSGVKVLPRQSLVHALNIRAIARKAARDMGKELEECHFVVAHLGGGISIVPMRKGAMIDANGASEEGPFSPDRAGNIPCLQFVKHIFSHPDKAFNDIRKMINGEGGLMAYLGTSDVREAIRRMESGDKEAELVLLAMVYQIAKWIGAMAVTLKGEIDAIVLTGGIAHSPFITAEIEKRVGFLAPVVKYPGENEMEALALGAFRVLSGEESARSYEKEVGK